MSNQQVNIDSLLSEAKNLSISKKLHEAFAIYQQLVSSYPDHLAVLEASADFLGMVGNFANSIEIYDRYLHIDPYNSKVWNKKAVALFSLKMVLEAVKCVEIALSFDPRNVESLYLLGKFYFDLANYELAIEKFDDSLKINSNFFLSLFNKSQVLFLQSKFEEAIKCLELCLAQDPSHTDSKFAKGLCLYKLRHYEESVEIFESLLKHNPSSVEILLNLASTLLESKDFEKALKYSESILLIKPDNFEANFYVGYILRMKGEFQKANSYFDKCLVINSDQIDVNFFKALNLIEQKDFAESLKISDELIVKFPKSHEGFFLKGLIFSNLQNYHDSIAWFHKSLSCNSNISQIHGMLGFALLELNEFALAIASFERSLEIESSNFFSYYNLAICYRKIHDNFNSATNYKKCLKLDPKHENSWIGLGEVYRLQNNFNESLDCFLRAVDINPFSEYAYIGICNISILNYQYERALENVCKMLEIKPDSEDGYLILCQCLANLERYDEAIKAYNKALDVFPNSVRLNWNMALFHILTGNYISGFARYDWRFKIDGFNYMRSYPKKMLDTLNVKNKTVFIYYEQGFGDTIQFSRFALVLHDLGAKVFLSVQESLQSLFISLHENITILSNNDSPSDFDYHIPVMSLPNILKIEMENIPFSKGYLSPSQMKIVAWKKDLTNKKKYTVGFSYNCSKIREHENRKISFDVFKLIFDLPLDFHSLQIELEDKERMLLSSYENVFLHDDQIKDFSDTAAIIFNLDIVITTDTSIVHVAGALGKQCLLLLPFPSDARWYKEGESTPWYDSIKIFRCTRENDWKMIINKVKKELELLIKVEKKIDTL